MEVSMQVIPFLLRLSVVAVVLGHGTQAVAARQITYEVPRGKGGVYEVPVHPDYVSVVYFPAEVTKAVAHNYDKFTIVRSGQMVTVQPLTGVTGWGNVTAECELFHVGLVFVVVDDPDQVASVVQLVVAEEEELFRKRLQKALLDRVSPFYERMNRYMASLAAAVTLQARQRVADGLLLRNQRVDVDRVLARTDRHVVVRVPGYSWIGDDVCIDFDIENLGRTPYRLAAAEVWILGQNRAAAVAFLRDVSYDGLGVVPTSRARKRGVVCVPEASRWVGEEFILVLREDGHPNEYLEVSAKLTFRM